MLSHYELARRLRLGALTAKAGAAFLVVAGVGFAAAPASAQELQHRFINPSFGGNPFYSEHLLAIANIHRPDAPEEPAEDPPSEEELLAAQLQAQFLSQVSSEIRQRILNAQPGETGEFELGDQRISFVRTATETQVTFLNRRTGETRRIVIPVPRTGFAGLSTGGVSAEQALGAGGAQPQPIGGSPLSGLLDSRSLELPLRGN